MSLHPVDPTARAVEVNESVDACRPEHCFHAFDALYCALTAAKPILPKFSDEK